MDSDRCQAVAVREFYSSVSLDTNTGSVNMTHEGRDGEYSRSRIEGTKPLLTQVAGHQYGLKGTDGMLDLGNGRVLKAVQQPPRGTRELGFYKMVFDSSCKDDNILTLRNFVPCFHGTVVKDGVTFMILDNVCSQYENPSVLDIKMGCVTSDPEAPPDKVEREKKKCPYTERLGFQLSGMRVFNEVTGTFDYIDKQACHKIPEESVLLEGLGKFFGLPQRLRKDVIQALLPKLRDIEKWFSSQKSFSFYASSLLIVYDTEHKTGHSNRKCENCGLRTESVKDKTRVDIHMIDFAHVFPSSDIDQNVLYGIHSLLKYLDQLLRQESNYS